MNSNLMIDFETLGTDPDSVILSIGACFFSETGVGNTFYRTIDVDDQLKKYNRTVSGSTIEWWIKQGEDAKKVFVDNRFPLMSTMTNFAEWYMRCSPDPQKVKVWGNGFDVAMAEHALKQTVGMIPWNFRKIRCLRTFKDFVANDAVYTNTKGTAHNALDDAINQANYVIKHSKGKL